MVLALSGYRARCDRYTSRSERFDCNRPEDNLSALMAWLVAIEDRASSSRMNAGSVSFRVMYAPVWTRSPKTFRTSPLSQPDAGVRAIIRIALIALLHEVARTNRKSSRLTRRWLRVHKTREVFPWGMRLGTKFCSASNRSGEGFLAASHHNGAFSGESAIEIDVRPPRWSLSSNCGESGPVDRALTSSKGAHRFHSGYAGRCRSNWSAAAKSSGSSTRVSLETISGSEEERGANRTTTLLERNPDQIGFGPAHAPLFRKACDHQIVLRPRHECQ